MTTREERAAARRATWSSGPMDAPHEPCRPPRDGAELTARWARLEALRRLAWTFRGAPWPTQPSSRAERQRWPLERFHGGGG